MARPPAEAAPPPRQAPAPLPAGNAWCRRGSSQNDCRRCGFGDGRGGEDCGRARNVQAHYGGGPYEGDRSGRGTHLRVADEDKTTYNRGSLGGNGSTVVLPETPLPWNYQVSN